MAYVFMDESGDLGFDWTKPNTSKFFIVTCLFIPNHRPLDKMVGKIFRKMPIKNRRSHCGTLHCTKEKRYIRKQLFTMLANRQDVSIMVIRLNKHKVYTKLQNEKFVLYNYVTNILLDRILSRKLIPANSNIKFIASRRETNKFLNQNFESYISEQIGNYHNISLQVEIKTPSSCKGLQVVDFASWATFRKYEHSDSSYYNIIKTRIAEDSQLFSAT